MTRDELNKKYFEWMYQLVYNDEKYRRAPHRKLLRYLHDSDFIYLNDMDSNRASDGVNLRYRFGYEHNYKDPMIATFLDTRPSSVLEMMIALSLRCEEHIMGDPELGNRTSQWFWNMIDNLGLGYNSCDDTFDRRYVDYVISRFLNLEYESNGEGGLFTVRHCIHDLRTVEIWYQMCWYLDSIA